MELFSDDEREALLGAQPLGWPELRWRGDGQKRALTCGTLLWIIGFHGGDPDDNKRGVPVETVLSEIGRLSRKYDPDNNADVSDYEIRGGINNIHTEPADVVAILTGLIEISGLVQFTQAADENAVELKLTSAGQYRLDAVRHAAENDKRYEWIDLKDPILEYNPVLDTEFDAAEREHAKEAVLPKRKNTIKRPTYRQWMEIAKGRPLAVIYSIARLSPTVRLSHENTSPGMEFEQCGVLAEKLDFIQPFVNLVLSGGPEGIWTGKPLNPEDIHRDVEIFSTAGYAGFERGERGDDVVRMSTIAVELYEMDPSSASTYSRLTYELRMEEEYAQRNTVWDASDDNTPIDEARHKQTGVGDSTLERQMERRVDQHAKTIVVQSAADSIRRSIEQHGIPPQALVGMTDGKLAKLSNSGRTPQVRCTYTNPKTGKQCPHTGIGGSGRCEIHEGSYLDEAETKSLLRSQQVRIFAATSLSIDTVLHLMQHATNESVRLAAALSMLSRAGLSERKEIDVRASVDVEQNRESPSDIVRNRLAILAGFASAKDMEEAQEKQTVDVEVVDEEES